MNTSDRIHTEDGSNEVEDLLRQAEDAALLKLSVNGHTAHQSSSDLPPDLAHRFRSLKSGPSTTKSTPKPTKDFTVVAELRGDELSSPIDDDPDHLFARFAALKASLPSPSSAAAASSSSPVKEDRSELSLGVDSGQAKVGCCIENHEDEVDKIMRWAIDAARLDPSPESDDSENEDDNNDPDSELDTSEEDDVDDDYHHSKKKK